MVTIWKSFTYLLKSTSSKVCFELGYIFQVCCPIQEELDLLENGDEYTYEGEYGYEYEHIYDCDNVFPPRQCPSDSSCVVRTKCGSKGNL